MGEALLRLTTHWQTDAAGWLMDGERIIGRWRKVRIGYRAAPFWGCDPTPPERWFLTQRGMVRWLDRLRAPAPGDER